MVVLVVAVLGLGYATWSLFEENQEMSESLAALEQDNLSRGYFDARGTREMAADIQQIQSQINTIEGRPSYGLGRDLGELDSDLEDLERKLASIESCTDSLVSYLEGNRTYIFC